MSVKRLVWQAAEENRAALLLAVERSRHEHPGSQLGVGSGWSSPKRLHLDQALADFVDWVRHEIGAGRHLDAWANVLEPGDVIRPHDHHQAQWTGIYCVDGAGELVVGAEPVAIEAGQMLVLSGLELHSVDRVETPRTSIVVNVYG